MAEQEQPHLPAAVSPDEAAAGILPSHGISINLPPTVQEARPPAITHVSTPAYQSPIRHHRRAPSRTKGIKETLNARSHYGSSDDDGAAVHRINQYVIKQEIGRGSFGAVHLAVDQHGNEYAVKEFSKSRLRKRAQSNLLRKPNQKRRSGHLAAGLGFNAPLHHRMSSQDDEEADHKSALGLIKEEIAIMKKLNHNNLVSLIEVLDDPAEDSLYMVLEMCKKGVVMKVDVEDVADPYDTETCRCWFRDMILGIEYLHAQGIIHRDIKPDNCLITEDDVLKIVDFGVSEMFEKQSDMSTAKSAGSPAFMPPELCVVKHGQVSGKAADLWSMGVTLYCLRYGKIPFEKTGVLELYEAIRNDGLSLEGENDEDFKDLMRRILDKDPDKRITMDELRAHPWVTKKGSDPLLSADENCADIVDPPTEAEMDNAITGNMSQLLVVMKAVKRFKKLLLKKRPELMEGIFGRSSRIVTPPTTMKPQSDLRASRSQDTDDRRPLERALTAEGVHREIEVSDDLERLPKGVDAMAATSSPSPKASSGGDGGGAVHQGQGEGEGHFMQRLETAKHHPDTHRSSTFPLSAEDHGKGHAHDPLMDTLFLDIGVGVDSSTEDDPQSHVVSESPPAVEMNVYETAYQEEMDRILQKKGRDATMYLNRRVEHRDDIRDHENVLDHSKRWPRKGAPSTGGLAGLVQKARENARANAESPAKTEKTEQDPEAIVEGTPGAFPTSP